MSTAILDHLSSATVAVIGDVMLDVYLKGTIERISPEAPVPVVRAQSQQAIPGGAANVAANIAALGGIPLLVGVVGEDADALQISLSDCGVTALEGLVVAADRQTIRKQRVMAGQQLVRIDFEDTHPIGGDVEAKLISRAIEAVRAADAVVLSDYGKGVLTDAVIRAVTEEAHSLAKIVVVDPKRRDFSCYRGATIITPNRAEMTAATGLPCETDDEAVVAVSAAQATFSGDILLTRSEKGLSFYPASGIPSHFPTRAQEVFDVSGAGDTVVGTLALILAAGAELGEAIRIANHAAGIVVAKAGTATTTISELRESIELIDGHAVGEGQLVSRQHAALRCREWQRRGLKVGLANGCFDLIHPGHISLIRQASLACDRLIMALNGDESVRRLKGPARPVQAEGARAEVIGAIKGVDLVVVFDEDTPLDLIEAVAPDVLFKGADYSIETVVGAGIVTERGGQVVLIDLVEGQSSSRLIESSAMVDTP